ncbi:MAG: hypothetical protein K6G16_04390 [Lachnospiraceae bacterium]|nr:hypothetical protein [Lachnospiraceae bacterium]
MANSGLNREDLIGALAAAMGQNNYSSTKYEESRYDVSTGTLYCQGYIISKTSVDEALEFFRAAKKKNERLADTDTAARNAALYYQVAVEAILMMQKTAITNGGKVIAKNDEPTG